MPIDSDKYAEGATVNAMQPDETEIAVSDGVWKFEGYDADSKVANTEHTDENGNIKFIGTWEFVNDKDAPIIFDESDKPSKPDSNKLNDHGSVETGDKTNILLWGIGTIISALAVLIVVSVKRKTNKS